MPMDGTKDQLLLASNVTNEDSEHECTNRDSSI